LSKRYYADLAGIKQAAFGDAEKGRGAAAKWKTRMFKVRDKNMKISS
jgi:hypothetical protein